MIRYLVEVTFEGEFTTTVVEYSSDFWVVAKNEEQAIERARDIAQSGENKSLVGETRINRIDVIRSENDSEHRGEFRCIRCSEWKPIEPSIVLYKGTVDRDGESKEIKPGRRCPSCIENENVATREGSDE